MNIAFISHIRDRTGYGHSAEGFIECLDSMPDINVTNLWTSLSNNPWPCGEQVTKLEHNSLNDIDTVIQYTLPEYFTKIDGVKNIGLFCWETTHFIGSNWQYYCNQMDQIWVLTPECKAACIESGVTVPVHEVDPPHSFEKYDHADLNLNIPNIKNKYVFYTVSEISYRKNVDGLIAAYYSTFVNKPEAENVALIIKGFIDGHSQQQTEERFNDIISQIKTQIKKGDKSIFPQIILIPEWLSDEQIMGLHKISDCYITMSRGEAENIPLFDACAMGNRCIAPNWNGPKKILKNTSHYLLNCSIKPVFGMTQTLPTLYNTDENWYEPSILDAKKAMSNSILLCHDDKKNITKSADILKNQFSYDTVGPKLKTILEL